MRLTLKDGTQHIVWRIIKDAAITGRAFAYLVAEHGQIARVVEFDWLDVERIDAAEGTEG